MAGFDTKCLHEGDEHNEVGAHVNPIYQTSTFVFKNAEQGAARFSGKEGGYIYTRLGNPTNTAVHKKLASIEGGEDAQTFASGMGAISAAVMAAAVNGDHIIAGDVLYGCTFNLFSGILQKLGIEVSFVDTSSANEIEKAIKENTKVIFLETPANPTMKLSDIKAIAALCKEKKLLLIVDNTFATPYFQNPLKLGADVVVHSATKYLGGHGDVIAGAVVGKKDFIEKARHIMVDVGAVLDPFGAWLVLRGIKTLGIRMRKHEENAKKIAEFLEKHPKIDHVFYPGLPSFSQHDLAKKQMRGFGAMLSFELKGGTEAGKKLMNSVKLCTIAVSLGTVDTLIQHPASMTHAVVPKEDKLKCGITDGLVRISVGIENVEDIIADLDQALSSV